MPVTASRRNSARKSPRGARADTGLTVALVGATGLVGARFLELLIERKFPVGRLLPYASSRSAGSTVRFGRKTIPVIDLAAPITEHIDLAFFSAGADIALENAERFVDRGAVVVDNSNAFRMAPHVPLVVPEVNPERIADHEGVIANPNCSTIQLVVALKPLADRFGLRRVLVTTMQSVSGTGTPAVTEMIEQSKAILAGKKIAKPTVYPHQIAFNALPQCDKFENDEWTTEELKVARETRKILELPKLKIAATCVRVPVMLGHSEAVAVELAKPTTAAEIRKLLAGSPGITVLDGPTRGIYPMATDAAGTDDVYVGRIRPDPSAKNAFLFWCVSDNIRKGAATNGLQIAERLFGLARA